MIDDGNEGGREGEVRGKERRDPGPRQTRYVTGYMGYISQIRRDAAKH